jgi:hypothetical protein
MARIGGPMDSEQTRIDIMKLHQMLWKQNPDKYIKLYGYPCKCKDTLSVMIDNVPTCAKCGKVQLN